MSNRNADLVGRYFRMRVDASFAPPISGSQTEEIVWRNTLRMVRSSSYVVIAKRRAESSGTFDISSTALLVELVSGPSKGWWGFFGDPSRYMTQLSALEQLAIQAEN